MSAGSKTNPGAMKSDKNVEEQFEVSDSRDLEEMKMLLKKFGYWSGFFKRIGLKFLGKGNNYEVILILAISCNN
jgi:hypothetical protein